MARMTDEEYIFRQEIKEKKAAGRGAFHRKCGAKSKKCTLPHERLSKKELAAMNGEVMSYDPRKWYTWEEFRKLKMEWQVNYVNSLITRYNCSCSGICQYVRKAGQLEFINNRDAHWRTTAAGDQKLKEAMERDLWPNRDEIQNGSNVINDIIKEAKEDEPYESPQVQIQKAINEAAKTVDLYLSRGMQLTPELINQIYEEKAGMSFAMAMDYVDDKVKNSEDPKPVQSVVPEDSTDVQAFSIIMNNLDPNVIEYVRDLFDGKKYVVSLEVKEIKE